MLLADMLLRHWLAEQGVTSLERASLEEVEYFAFGEDRYYVKMRAGNMFQDNDLDRMLAVVKAEFETHNATVTLRQSGRILVPAIDYLPPSQIMCLRQRFASYLLVIAHM